MTGPQALTRGLHSSAPACPLPPVARRHCCLLTANLMMRFLARKSVTSLRVPT